MGRSACWIDAGRHNNVSADRSILIATTSQFHAAATFVELDGVARRVILYPPDLSLDHVNFVADSAGVDVIVSDRFSGTLDSVASIAPTGWTRLGNNRDSRNPTRNGMGFAYLGNHRAAEAGGPHAGESHRSD